MLNCTCRTQLQRIWVEILHTQPTVSPSSKIMGSENTSDRQNNLSQSTKTLWCVQKEVLSKIRKKERMSLKHQGMKMTQGTGATVLGSANLNSSLNPSTGQESERSQAWHPTSLSLFSWVTETFSGTFYGQVLGPQTHTQCLINTNCNGRNSDDSNKWRVKLLRLHMPSGALIWLLCQRRTKCLHSTQGTCLHTHRSGQGTHGPRLYNTA